MIIQSIIQGKGSGGLFTELIVHAPIGSIVTCTTPSGLVLTVPEVSGVWIFSQLQEIGVYNILVVKEEKSITKNVNVDIIGRYNIFCAFYEYGDGHLNTVANGYGNTLYLNGQLLPTPTPSSNTESNFKDFQGTTNIGSFMTDTHLNQTRFSSGTTTYDFITPVDSTTDEKTFWVSINCGGWASSQYIGSIKFNVDGTNYTMKELVDNEIVKPIVIINAGAYRDVNTNALNWYAGGDSNRTAYWGGEIMFMLNKGHKITSMQAYSNITNSNTDGISSIKSGNTDYCRFTIAPY